MITADQYLDDDNGIYATNLCFKLKLRLKWDTRLFGWFQTVHLFGKMSIGHG